MPEKQTITCTKIIKTRVEPTENVQACAAMFGIGVDEDRDMVLYKDLKVDVGPGRIVFITGESGAGKSCLMRDLMPAGDDPRCRIVRPRGVEDFSPLPLVEQFDRLSLKETLELLSTVGISDAFVFLRKPQELSDGQRYRFMLAMAIYEAIKADDEVYSLVFIDEFLAFLDRETAKNVAYQTRQVANRSKIGFVVATTHVDICKDLQADLTITMRLNITPQVDHNPLAGVSHVPR